MQNEDYCEFCKKSNTGNPCNNCTDRLYEFWKCTKNTNKIFVVEEGETPPLNSKNISPWGAPLDLEHSRGFKLRDGLILLFGLDDGEYNMPILVYDGWIIR